MVTGNCGDSVACRSSGYEIKYANGKTASSDDYSYTTTVPQSQLHMCIKRCKAYCVDAGPRGIEAWPNCKVFSSYLKVGGTCYCYEWATKPSWYNDSGYDAGWCENKLLLFSRQQSYSVLVRNIVLIESVISRYKNTLSRSLLVFAIS